MKTLLQPFLSILKILMIILATHRENRPILILKSNFALGKAVRF